MRYNVVVATHHKTGTVWMDGVFKSIAADLGARFVNLRDEQGRLKDLANSPFVLFCYDSDFGEHASLLDREDVRILHLIRDPRDVVISAMHYHKASRESWLHEPIPGYDNLTYQRALQKAPNRLARYIFEMENSSASTLRDMARWRYGRANCFEARYEDLRQDSALAHWARITAFLGLDVAEQALAHAFLERFPGLLQSLGYETSDAWVHELRRQEEPGVLSGLQQIALDHWDLIAKRARLPSKF